MAKKSLTKTYSGVNAGIIPSQVNSTINLDSNIDSYVSKLSTKYKAVEDASTKLENKIKTELSNNKKYYNGAIRTNLEYIKTKSQSQKKAAAERVSTLKKRIKSDTSEINTVVTSAKYYNEIQNALKTSIDPSVVALGSAVTGMATQASTQLGYSTNSDGTVTKNGITYTVDTENNRLTPVSSSSTSTTTTSTSTLADQLNSTITNASSNIDETTLNSITNQISSTLSSAGTSIDSAKATAILNQVNSTLSSAGTNVDSATLNNIASAIKSLL